MHLEFYGETRKPVGRIKPGRIRAGDRIDEFKCGGLIEDLSFRMLGRPNVFLSLPVIGGPEAGIHKPRVIQFARFTKSKMAFYFGDI